jgi:hypothetical protein
VKYPTDMVSDDGWTRLHQGHGLSRYTLWLDLKAAHYQPPDSYMHTEEVYLRYVPRVKWCERLDGWACDNQGEWHAHWVAVQRNDDCAFTIARWKRRPASRDLGTTGEGGAA